MRLKAARTPPSTKAAPTDATGGSLTNNGTTTEGNPTTPGTGSKKKSNGGTNASESTIAATPVVDTATSTTRPSKSWKSLLKEIVLFTVMALVLWRSRRRGKSLAKLTMDLTESKQPRPPQLVTTAPVVLSTTQKAQDNTQLVEEDPNGGGIYFCGYVNFEMASHMFPDYMNRYVGGLDSGTHDYLPSASHSKRTPNNKSILVYGLHGSCAVSIQRFPGKVLFVNGEPNGPNMIEQTHLPGKKQRGEDVYQIGLLPDSAHSVMIFHGAWNMLRLDSSIWPTLWDPQQKPINSGQFRGLAYMNRQCYPHREAAVNRISSIMTVFHGGDCRGMAKQQPTHPSFQRMTNIPKERFWVHNLNTYHEYTFCMAMENSRTQHYMSEKILMAFLSGCIPVYFGSNEIFDVFNKDAFVFYEIDNPMPALALLKELHTNQTAYQEMLRQPIMANGNQTVHDYFSVSDQIGGGYLKQKLRKVMGLPT